MPGMARQHSRPRWHYAPRQTWMNDPNGLIFNAGTWHLFYQSNPFDSAWGNMSWGHATSPDLLTWTEHPVALWHTDTEEIYSGSCVFDAGNSSGLGTADWPPLVAIYTANHLPGSARRASRPRISPTAWTGAATGRPTPATRCSIAGRPTFVTRRCSGTVTPG